MTTEKIGETVIPYSSFFGESLPGPVAPFARELSQSYGVAIEPILAVCLAVAGDAVGGAPGLSTGLGADLSSTNLHVMVSPGANTSFSYVLSHILAPMRAFQKNGFENYRNNNPAALAAQIKGLEKEFTAWKERDRFPNAKHRLLFEAELAKLRAAAQPICFLENPTPKLMLGSLEKSAGSILVLAEASTAQRLLDETPDLLRAGWRRQPFPDPFLSGQSHHIPVDPAFSLIGTCGPGTLSQLLTEQGLIENGLSAQFLIWSLGDAPGTLTDAALQPLRQQSSWNNLIQRLLNNRLQPPRVYELSLEAKSLLFAFANQALIEISLVEQAVRIALIYHLCMDEPGPVVERATIGQAIALTRRFAAHRRLIISEATSDEAESEAAAQVMLAKIRGRSRLRPRELFRMYCDQRKTIHQPVLNHLLAAGLVFQDSVGFLTVVEPSALGEQTRNQSSGTPKVALLVA